VILAALPRVLRRFLLVRLRVRQCAAVRVGQAAFKRAKWPIAPGGAAFLQSFGWISPKIVLSEGGAV